MLAGAKRPWIGLQNIKTQDLAAGGDNILATMGISNFYLRRAYSKYTVSQNIEMRVSVSSKNGFVFYELSILLIGGFISVQL